MRKNTARHWLHAALDLLPVILIPVFMIYSHRHVLTERTEVDIQYKYQSNEVNSLDDLVANNIYYVETLLTGSYEYAPDYFILKYGYSDLEDYTLTLDANDYSLNSFLENNLYIRISEQADGTIYIYLPNNNTYISLFVTNPITFDDVILFTNSDNLQEFISYLDEQNVLPQYTDYNVIESVDVQDTNSSIMNVFMDDFNYSVNKYFDMGNVFNLKDVYHWFEVNIFNNNPPVVMASIYNIIVYEFVMDLLFLLYGLFMWFVDMLKRLIEKPIDSIK